MSAQRLSAEHEIDVTPEYDAIVVGAGFAGLYALHRLRRQGLSVRVFEGGSGVGGTWFWNRYPGARCDIESIDYQYSFSEELVREWRWSERYPRQEELLRYLNHVADRFDLRRDIQLDTTVVSAVYDEPTGTWVITTDRGDRVRARYCLMAVGALSVPRKPDLPGLDEFAGECYHTAEWPDHEVDFAGKRVAVVGTGSSGIQLIPIVAEQAAELLVFQRTANFSVPAFNRPADTPDADATTREFHERRELSRRSMLGLSAPLNEKSALEVSNEERIQEYEKRWQMGGLPMYGAFADLLVSKAANDTAVAFIHDKIRQKVHDAATAERLLPTGYPLGGKRICVDTGYFETFNRDNVTLVDVSGTPIDRITPRGLLVGDTEYAVDTIVFATGFDAITGPYLRIDIRGRDGLALRDKWADHPSTYLGLATAGFPNLFLVTGPGSPAVFSNVVVSIEQHVDWISDAIAQLRSRGLNLIEATPEAERAWVEHVDEVAAATLIADVDSWYTGANVPGKRKVFMPYLGGVGPYRQRCDEVAARGYEGFVLDEVPARTSVALSDGVRLEVTATGTGEPLVLVCGTSQDHRLWAPLLPGLSARYRVISYNHRGIGASGRGEQPMTVSALADDLAELLDGLGVPRAHVVGWSLGSAVAQELALKNPERVSSLVLCATWASSDAFQRAMLTALAHPWRTRHRDVALAALGVAYSREFLASGEFGPTMAALKPLFPATEEQMATVVEQWDADLAHDTLARLGRITAPTLVVAGEQDLLTPPDRGQAVADAIPGARFELFTGPGSSHALLMERADEFTSLVVEFLSTVPLA